MTVSILFCLILLFPVYLELGNEKKNGSDSWGILSCLEISNVQFRVVVTGFK